MFGAVAVAYPLLFTFVHSITLLKTKNTKKKEKKLERRRKQERENKTKWCLCSDNLCVVQPYTEESLSHTAAHYVFTQAPQPMHVCGFWAASEHTFRWSSDERRATMRFQYPVAEPPGAENGLCCDCDYIIIKEKERQTRRERQRERARAGGMGRLNGAKDRKKWVFQ